MPIWFRKIRLSHDFQAVRGFTKRGEKHTKLEPFLLITSQTKDIKFFLTKIYKNLKKNMKEVENL